MKKRRIAVIAFMLVAVLTIGIGYAALTDLLTIRGSVEIKAENANLSFDEKIYFTAAEVTEGITTGSETIVDTAVINSDPDVAAFTANSLEDSASKVVFTFTVSNFSDHKAAITVNATQAGNESSVNPSNSNASYFDITYVIGDGTNNVLDAKTGTVDVVVTVKLKDGVLPPTAGSVTANYVLELSVASVN